MFGVDDFWYYCHDLQGSIIPMVIPMVIHEVQLLLEVVEQYPTWPNTQAFLQMIREEVTPEMVNFSLPGRKLN